MSPSSGRRHVSPIHELEVPESPKLPEEPPMLPQAPEGSQVDEPVPPQDDEADEPVLPQVFGGVPLELSLLPFYPYHTARHIWDEEDRDPLKFINHGRKFIGLLQPSDEWFQATLSLSGMQDLCKTAMSITVRRIHLMRWCYTRDGWLIVHA
ncbi:unnamed protein product [Lathyrus oleraceus]